MVVQFMADAMGPLTVLRRFTRRKLGQEGLSVCLYALSFPGILLRMKTTLNHLYGDNNCFLGIGDDLGQLCLLGRVWPLALPPGTTDCLDYSAWRLLWKMGHSQNGGVES